MKKPFIIFGVILVLIVALAIIFFYNSGENEQNITSKVIGTDGNVFSTEGKSTNYSFILENIQKCNENMTLDNRTDLCTVYHKASKECYSSSKALFYCFGGNGDIFSSVFGLTNEEAKELCFAFLHKGLTANCLRRLASTEDEIKECIEFASGDEYLIAICNLELDEKMNESLGAKSIQEYI